MNSTAGKILIDGNSAAAMGCVFAGVTVVTWYPITPSSSLVEALIGYMKRCRIDPATGKATYAVVQAEDELAAIGMVIGASWAGARAMTATSGPGISLMSEFVGLAYYAEVPAVIWDVQRVGPSTGLPTRTQQCDILKNAVLSHGDTRHPVLFPSSPEECFTMARTACDLAEEFQTPVFVNSDLDLGMNNWMADPFEYPDEPLQRGKVLTKEDLERLGGFARYADVDGDGVGWRTLPGTAHPAAAYFTRGSGHNAKAGYTEETGRLRGQRGPPAPQVRIDSRGGSAAGSRCERESARIGMVFTAAPRSTAARRAATSCAPSTASRPARCGCWPIRSTRQLEEFIARHDRVYVVEQNRDAQLLGLMRLDLDPRLSAKLRSVRYYGGLPLDGRTVTDEILSQEAL